MRRVERRAFTLVEILVVITIILLVAIVAMPVFNSLSGKQVTDAARIFNGGLVGIRDSAIKYNEPRGIRLLPDPVLTIPAPGQPGAGTLQLCYNRYIPIEPSGDYSEGRVNIGPQYYPKGTPDATFPPIYWTADNLSYPYPYPETPGISQVLMVEGSPYEEGFSSAARRPNSPTNWYWNIRVGDKIKIGGAGRSYTIIGPCVINPDASVASGLQGNPERFVNVGPPGTVVPLERSYYPPTDSALPAALTPFAVDRPEFLFLVNGEDDEAVGFFHPHYIDEGYDGRNNNLFPPPPVPVGQTPEYTDAVIDDPTEWETERWLGSLSTNVLQDVPTNTPRGSPSADWLVANFKSSTRDAPYLIKRRAVPSQGAREVMLPAGTTIDATSWNTTQERSRIPIEGGSLYCDIMVNPAGQFVASTQYSTPVAQMTGACLHFWLTSREDVHPLGTLWKDAAGKPTTNPTAGRSYQLPLQAGTLNYSPGAAPVLKGDRRLISMFAQSGLIVTNTVENVPQVSSYLPGEGFSVTDVNYPFYKAQNGLREAR